MSAVSVDEILEHQLNANMLLMPYEVYGQLFDSVAELGEENTKLRELVRDMWLHSYCSIAKTREDDERHIEDVIDRMRELGVDA